MNVYIGRRDDYSAMRGPCPEGFHIPSKEWWEGVIQILTRTFGMEINGPTLGTYLKMPMAGSRSRFTSEVSGVGTSGDYWSCTPGSSSPLFGSEFGFETKTSTILPMREFGRAFGYSLRGFKDSPVVPTSSWTTLYDGGNGAGIFRSSAEGLISISGNGLTRCTMQDKNLGATTVYNQGDTLTNANCGKFYQWGNNYGFAHSGAVTTSTTQVDASGYGPKNYYSSSTFIMNNNDWSSVQNDDLRGYVTGIQAVGHPIKNAYIGEYVEESFVVSQLGSYTNLYKSGHSIERITATGTFTLSSQQQFYLRIHTAQSETNGMWGWVFDKADGANRWDLQLVVNNAWSTIHTGGQGEIGSSNTFSVTIGKESGSITLNGNTTQITYTTTEKNRIATIFGSSTPYFFTSAYQAYSTISSWSNTITVIYS